MSRKFTSQNWEEYKLRKQELRSVVSLEVEGASDSGEEGRGEGFSRLHLLLSPQQMIEENYPLPVCVGGYTLKLTVLGGFMPKLNQLWNCPLPVC